MIYALRLKRKLFYTVKSGKFCMCIRNNLGFYRFGAILSRCWGGVAGIARSTERTKISVKVLGDVELSIVDVREVHPIIKMIKIFLHVDRSEN